MFTYDYDLARIAYDPADDIRLGKQARCDSTVSIGQLQQVDFGRAQSRRSVWLQGRSYPKIARRPKDAFDSDLLRDPNRDRVPGFCQRHAEGHHTLELAIVI